MGRGMWSWIVPDGLWEIAKPLIPSSRGRPQGGGTQDTPDETLFAAIVYVLVNGCAWRQLPPCFGISKSTAHRRFLIWSRAGVWGRLHEAVRPTTKEPPRCLCIAGVLIFCWHLVVYDAARSSRSSIAFSNSSASSIIP